MPRTQKSHKSKGMAAPPDPRWGAKMKALRRREGLTQAQMASRLGISASYLNLIENQRRPLSANLLLALARTFDIDVQQFAEGEDAQLRTELMEVFADPVFEDAGLTNHDVTELAAGQPAAGRAVLRLYRELQTTREAQHSLAARVANADDPTLDVGPRLLPGEEVSDFIDNRRNYFPRLEAAAEGLWSELGLEEESFYPRLCQYLHDRFGVRVEVARGDEGGRFQRHYDARRKRLALSELIAPRTRNFQLAHQTALLAFGELIDDEIRDARELTLPESERLARVAMANVIAAALLMPYEPFFEAAEAERYDIELLGHRFRTSFEQVCHRLTSLRRPGAEGVPFHLIRVDVAGNISKRFSGSGIRFARYSGACARWNVFTAFNTPNLARVQVSEMPDGTGYLCVSRTTRATTGGYGSPAVTYAVGLGCRLEYADRLVYGDHVDTERPDARVPIGTSCRICERADCAQRAFPALAGNFSVDENVRGLSFYMAPNDGERSER